MTNNVILPPAPVGYNVTDQNQVRRLIQLGFAGITDSTVDTLHPWRVTMSRGLMTNGETRNLCDITFADGLVVHLGITGVRLAYKPAMNFIIPIGYNETNGNWRVLFPTQDNSNGGFVVEMRCLFNVANFRLRNTSGANLDAIHWTFYTFAEDTPTPTIGLPVTDVYDGVPANADFLPSKVPASSVSGIGTVISPAFVALTDAATITWATGGLTTNNATVTLGGNRTLSITGAVGGAEGYLEITQDATGGRTLTLPSGTIVGSTTSISTVANKVTALAWSYNGASFTFVMARQG